MDYEIINQLPIEILSIIFDNIENIEVTKLRIVCKLWKNIVENNNNLYKQLYLPIIYMINGINPYNIEKIFYPKVENETFICDENNNSDNGLYDELAKKYIPFIIKMKTKSFIKLYLNNFYVLSDSELYPLNNLAITKYYSENKSYSLLEISSKNDFIIDDLIISNRFIGIKYRQHISIYSFKNLDNICKNFAQIFKEYKGSHSLTQHFHDHYWIKILDNKLYIINFILKILRIYLINEECYQMENIVLRNININISIPEIKSNHIKLIKSFGKEYLIIILLSKLIFYDIENSKSYTLNHLDVKKIIGLKDKIILQCKFGIIYLLYENDLISTFSRSELKNIIQSNNQFIVDYNQTNNLFLMFKQENLSKNLSKIYYITKNLNEFTNPLNINIHLNNEKIIYIKFHSNNSLIVKSYNNSKENLYIVTY
jgi:hypothetical protein